MPPAHPFSPLDPDLIETDLRTRHVGRQIQVWNQVTSTSDLALKAAGLAANSGLVILADEQTAGRGQPGRTWIAPKGSSLLLSIVLHPPAECSTASQLICLAALAVAEALEPLLSQSVSLKWPNDILLEGRKLGGILVERVPADPGARQGRLGTVIGIGLNVHQAPPEGAGLRATCLADHATGELARSLLVRQLLQRLDQRYDELCRGEVAELLAGWQRRAQYLGQMVTITTPEGARSGTIRALDPVQGATLQVGEGTLIIIPGTDIRQVEPLR